MPTLLQTKSAGYITDMTIMGMLQMREAWSTLTPEQQRSIYACLAELHDPVVQEKLHADSSVSPLKHELYGGAITEFLAHIEDHIKDGASTKAWQDEARCATRARAEGRYDGTKAANRETPACIPGMKASAIEHRRTHNLLLISKLLNQREAASPFTLVIDSVEQSAGPLLAEYLARAKKASTRTILVSLETIRKPPDVDVYLPCWQAGSEPMDEVLKSRLDPAVNHQTTLIVIDCLNTLCSDGSSNLPALLSSFIRPNVSLVALFHADVPVPCTTASAYRPTPLQMLKFLATTIITVHSQHHVLGDAAADRDRRAAEHHGLGQGISGLVVGEGAQGKDGIVLELEFRRKSGRGVREWYHLPVPSGRRTTAGSVQAGLSKAASKEDIILLEDYPRYQEIVQRHAAHGEDEEHDTTFNTNLTERQRQDREGIVLPYFDAQTGGGEGGRILYDMTAEDDFDDEEDEI